MDSNPTFSRGIPDDRVEIAPPVTPKGRRRVALLRRVMRAQFAIVAALLLADLHSSLLATSGKWETNPFISALGEHIGLAWALVLVKACDFVLLGVLYAAWKRWMTNVAVSLVLLVAALNYILIVIDNYSR